MRTRMGAFVTVLAAVSLLMVGASRPASAQAAAYIAATWSDGAVHFLDSNLNDLGSFSTGSNQPNGIATNGSLIWTGHFTTQEVIAYNSAGVEQFRWGGNIGGLQGMDFLNGEILIYDQWSNVIAFYDAYTGAFLRRIPGISGTEGIVTDGSAVWQLVDSSIYLSSLADGTLLGSIPNAAAGDPFDGTGLANSGPGELTLASANGNWYKVSKLDGSVLSSGNNQLDMFGLKTFTGRNEVPEPGPVALLVSAGVVGVLLARRRK